MAIRIGSLVRYVAPNKQFSHWNGVGIVRKIVEDSQYFTNRMAHVEWWFGTLAAINTYKYGLGVLEELNPDSTLQE